MLSQTSRQRTVEVEIVRPECGALRALHPFGGDSILRRGLRYAERRHAVLAPPQWLRAAAQHEHATIVAVWLDRKERGTCNDQTSVGVHVRACMHA